MFKKKYKKYPLEFSGDPYNGIKYFLTIYSGSKPLKMVVDSGADRNMIGNIHINGSSYHNTGIKTATQRISGETYNRLILLDFNIGGPVGNNKATFNLEFDVAFKKDSPLLNSNNFAGILGTTFLQYCDINLREGYIKVYNKPGAVSKALSVNLSFGDGKEVENIE